MHTTPGLTSTHFPLTSMKRTQKGSDLEVTSLSRRFWPQMDSSTLQTQYWEPTGAAGEGGTVYAMGPGGSSSRLSVGQHRDKPQCWQAPNILPALLSWAHTAWPEAQPPALSHTQHQGSILHPAPAPDVRSASPAQHPRPAVSLLQKLQIFKENLTTSRERELLFQHALVCTEKPHFHATFQHKPDCCLAVCWQQTKAARGKLELCPANLHRERGETVRMSVMPGSSSPHQPHLHSAPKASREQFCLTALAAVEKHQ